MSISITSIPETTATNMRNILANGIFVITFVKTDATIRTMHGTLMESMIPESDRPKSSGDRAADTDNVRVYDLDEKAWRTFRVSSVITLQMFVANA